MAALITPEQLIVYLDLPADTQPYDRAQLVCDLVIEAVSKVAGGALTEPYPTGARGIAFGAAGRMYENPLALRSSSTGGEALTYAGDSADVLAVLTQDERDELSRIFASSAAAPVFSFPAARAWPDPIRVDC